MRSRCATGAIRWLGVLTLFVLLAVAHTWPLARDAATHQLATPDSTTGAWSLIGIAARIAHGSARVFDGNNLYPADRTLAVVDHQLGSTPVAVPVLVAGGEGMLAVNLSLIASFALSGALMAALVRRLTGSLAAGIIAGCVLAWSAGRVNEIHHPHVLITQWIPVALLGLHLFIERPTIRRWLVLAAGAVAVALSSMHVAQIGGIALALVAGMLLLSRREMVPVRALAGTALAGGVALAALAPIAAVYVEVAARWQPPGGQGRETVGSLVDMSLRPADMLALAGASAAPYAEYLPEPVHVGVFPGFVVLVLAALSLTAAARTIRPLRPIERLGAFTAVIAGALVLVGVVAATARLAMPVAAIAAVSPVVVLGIAAAALLVAWARRVEDSDDRVVLVYATLLIAGLLLSLGPRIVVDGTDLGSGVARYDLLPIPLMIRAPARFVLLADMGLAVLAGLGLAGLLRRRNGWARWAIIAVVFAAVNAEAAFEMPRRVPVPAPTPVDRWLRETAEPGAVIEYPLVEGYWAVYRSYRYGRRTVVGAGYIVPPALRWLEAVPDFSPAQFAVLWRYFRPRFVVVRLADFPPDRRAEIENAIAAAGPALVPRFSDGDDRVYQLVDRGRGPVLIREWPGRLLRKGPALLGFQARVTSDDGTTVPELTVMLNDQVLWAASGAELEDWNERWIEFDPDVVVDGPNRFELRADYTLAPEVAPRSIGRTGSSTPADLSVFADEGRALVQVNGRQLVGGYGYLVVVLDPNTGKVTNTASFDTYGDESAAAGLAYFLRRIPPGTPVIVASRYDAGRYLTDEAVRALQSLGMSVDLRLHRGQQHAAIGVQGALPGTALERVAPESATVQVGMIRHRRVQLRWLDLGDQGTETTSAIGIERTMAQPSHGEPGRAGR
jgi:hypothetical protein